MFAICKFIAIFRLYYRCLMTNGLYPQTNFGDYQQVKTFVQGTEQQVEKADSNIAVAAAESTLPMFRRVASLPEKLRNNEYLPAVGLTGLALMNLPEDWRDVKAAGKQVLSKVDKNYHYDPLYNRATHQHSFSFLRGTAIEKHVNKKTKQGSKFFSWLKKSDTTLAKSKFGMWVQNQLGVSMEHVNRQTKILNAEGHAAKAYKFKGSAFGKMTARAMKRIPVLSVAALALIEMPKILKSFANGETRYNKVDDAVKQTVKSGVNVTSILAGVGYGGAIGAKYGGAFGSLLGMGVGAITGSKTSQKIQEFIG